MSESDQSVRDTQDRAPQMERSDWPIALATLALLVVGVAAWQLYLREPALVDTRSLAGLPLELGAWSGEEIDVADQVSEMLEADVNIQRAYAHEIDGFVWFYLGYYGSQEGTAPIHTPPYCYESQGWKILSASVVPLGSGQLSANELVVEREGQRRLVRFWYQSHNRSGMLTNFDRVLSRMQGLLLDGRSDGSLVRVSTPLADPGELPRARARLVSFVREMEPELTRHWPAEYSPST